MDIFQMIVTIMCSVIAPSGFWTFVQKNFERQKSETVAPITAPALEFTDADEK